MTFQPKQGRPLRSAVEEKCNYAGHKIGPQHEATVTMRSPPDSHGNQRRVACCEEAALMAEARGWARIGGLR